MAVFGLDIGTTLIKAVQLEQRGGGFSLLAAGISPVSASIVTGVEKDLLTVAEAVKKLVTDAKISARDVNISLPEANVYSRLMELPYLTDEEVSSAISWQAEPYIPIPLSDASIAYQIVERREPRAASQGGVEVLLIASPKELVRRYMRVADLAGLSVSTIETELLALSRSLAPQGQTVIVADIGATSTDLAVVRSGQLMVTRSIPTAGNVLTRTVSSGLSINLSQAEEYKKAYGLTAGLDGKVRVAVDPALRLIVEEIKKTIQYYKTEVGKDDQISWVVLSGGTAGMLELSTLFANELGVKTVIGDPFSRVAKDERSAKMLGGWASLYGIAVGLAQNI